MKWIALGAIVLLGCSSPQTKPQEQVAFEGAINSLKRAYKASSGNSIQRNTIKENRDAKIKSALPASGKFNSWELVVTRVSESISGDQIFIYLDGSGFSLNCSLSSTAENKQTASKFYKGNNVKASGRITNNGINLTNSGLFTSPDFGCDLYSISRQY